MIKIAWGVLIGMWLVVFMNNYSVARAVTVTASVEETEFNKVESVEGADFHLYRTNIYWVSDESQVNAKLSEYEAQHPTPNGYYLAGLAQYNDMGECTIWAHEPRDVDDYDRMETLGHEMLHCFRGSYHN